MGIEQEPICNPSKSEFLALDILNIVISSLALVGSFLTIVSYILKIVRHRIREKQIQQAQAQQFAAGGLSSSITIGIPGSHHYGQQVAASTQLKQPSSKLPFLIFMLSVADFFTSLFIIISQSYLIHSPISYSHDVGGKIHFSACIGFRSVIQFFFLSTFFWTTCISYYLYHQLSSPGEEKYLLLIFNIVSWGIPLSISLILTLTNSIVVNSDTNWCEVSKPMELSLWFLPLFLCLCICSIYYFRLRRLFREKFQYRLAINDRLKQLDTTISRRLTLYIVVFVACWVPDVIQHFISFFSNCSFFPLLIISNISAGQGFFNFWIYSYTNRVARFSSSSQNEENKRLLYSRT